MMRIPLFGSRRDYVIESLSTQDAPHLARLHTEGFSRPWSDGELASMLSQETTFGFLVREVGNAGAKPAGFVLARLAAGEAEILTIAVSRAHRRQGLGWRLMDAVLRHLHSERAQAVFLEVEPGNQAAIGLYRRLGFREVGRRKDYYPGPGGGSALVMRRDLR